eukprot:748438-Hanusia_phi.AAC.2
MHAGECPGPGTPGGSARGRGRGPGRVGMLRRGRACDVGEAARADGLGSDGMAEGIWRVTSQLLDTKKESKRITTRGGGDIVTEGGQLRPAPARGSSPSCAGGPVTGYDEG